MARQLWLLRHADAEPHGSRPDAQRALTARGERQARLAGLALARLQVNLEGILVSPKVRAQQTAQLAAAAGDEDRGGARDGEAHELVGLLQTHEPLAGGFDAAQALDALSLVAADGHLMVVGHEPDLSGVVGELTGARIDLKKGGLAVVRLEGGVGGRRPASRTPRSSRSDGASGELVILLRPRELALIADLATADV